MNTMISRIATAGFVFLAGLGALTPSANADNIVLGLNGTGVVDVQYRDERDWGQRHRHGHGWGNERRGRCDPWLATDKARNQGLRRARVVDVTPRRVVVDGRRHGERHRIVFANVRGCPTLGRW